MRAPVPLSYGTIGEDTRSLVLDILDECSGRQLSSKVLTPNIVWISCAIRISVDQSQRHGPDAAQEEEAEAHLARS